MKEGGARTDSAFCRFFGFMIFGATLLNKIKMYFYTAHPAVFSKSVFFNGYPYIL